MQQIGPGPASGGRAVPQTCLLLEALRNTVVWQHGMKYYVIWEENSQQNSTQAACDDICSDIKAHDLMLMGLLWINGTFKELGTTKFTHQSLAGRVNIVYNIDAWDLALNMKETR